MAEPDRVGPGEPVSIPSSGQEQPGSPEWWRRKLGDKLTTQAKRVDRLEKYYDGEHPLPDPPRSMVDAEVFAEAKAAFTTLSKLGVTNWVRMVARAPVDRLTVRGFRFGDSPTPDDTAWRLWQANHLDAESRLLHETVFSTGQSYGLVWPQNWPPQEGDVPSMTCEHPSQMIVAYAAGSRRRRSAALKRWEDDDGHLMATLYLPDGLYKWRSRSALAAGGADWEQRQGKGEEWPLANPLEVVPVVEFAINTGLRARPYGGGVGEFEGVLSIQDRINKTIFDRLVTAESQAFRQRYAIGWEPPLDPKTNQPDPRATYRASQSMLWTFGDEKVKVGDFSQADFAPFIKAVESDVNAMGAITQTPPHYLLGAMVNIAADGMVVAETGLASKTEGHANVLSDPWEEFVGLGLAAIDSAGAADKSSMVIWADFERRSWAEKIDGLVKLKAIGVPDEELWAMIPGATPQDVKRWKSMRSQSALLGGLLNPTPPAPSANGTGEPAPSLN